MKFLFVLIDYETASRYRINYCLHRRKLGPAEKTDEVRTLIESNKDWFSAYVDLKSSAEELKNTKFEVTPDQLLNLLKNSVVKSTLNLTSIGF